MTQEEWIGLIPAAGKGTRLSLPYPKELYPVIRNNRYKPVSQFALENIVRAGVGHVVFVINETKHQLIQYFGNGSRFHCKISYVFQEPLEDPAILNMAGFSVAMDSGYHLARGKTVFFAMPDTIIQPPDALQRASQAIQPEDDMVLGLFETANPQKFGMVRMDEEGIVQEIVDKPAQTDLKWMWGCLIWRPRFSEFLHEVIYQHGIYHYASIMNEAIKSGMRFRGVHFPGGTYIDLGTYDEITELDRRYREE